jgi:hypothetical protein
MPFVPFVVITIFIFVAIVGGLIGIILEGRRAPIGVRDNPATTDAVYPIVGWAILFALYLALVAVGDENLTLEFKNQLGTLAVLPFYYAVLATARLIWRSARRIYARLSGPEPVAWRAIPFLSALRFPLLFLSALLSAATELLRAGLSLSFLLLMSVLVFVAFIRKP